MWLLVLLLGFSVYAASYMAKDRNHRAHLLRTLKQDCQLPPELPKRWPLGIDRILEIWNANSEKRLLAFFCSVADDYEPGNTLYQFLLFGPRTFHILDPKNIEAISSINFKDYSFGARPAVFAPLLGDGIFTQEGTAWKHSRELLRKQFARAQYHDIESSFGEHVDNLLALLPTDAVVDLQPLFFNLTMDIATALLFGHSVYSLRAGIDQVEKNKDFAKSFNIALEGLAKRFRLGPFHSLYSPPKFRKACRQVHAFVEEYIAETKFNNEDYLNDAQQEDKSWFIRQVAAESSTITQLRDQLLNVLLAGRDTTACCLSWIFRLLIRHDDVLTRLRTEVSEHMSIRGDITRAKLRDLPYLSCVIKESLRLYPSVPLNTREAVTTTSLPTGGGPQGDRPILVRKGEVVVFSQYITSRRKNIYGADADEFRPERWETGELANIGWAYIPFHGGPRQCLGKDFAIMEISYTVVRFLQTYASMELPPGESLLPVGSERQKLTLVLSSADGCKVLLRGVSTKSD